MTIDAPHLLLVSEALPATDAPMRQVYERPPPIFDVVTGSAADILTFMRGPPQHDDHVRKWNWHQHQKRFPNWTNEQARAIGRELGRRR